MSGLTAWVGSIHQRLDSWARQQRDLVVSVAAPLPQVLPWRPRWQWPWKWSWQGARDRKEELEEEYRRRKEQIQNLCHALKAEDVTDLKDILSAMILSECVYKRPDSEVVRAVNTFKANFGGQLVHLERVQPSLDHVSHRYLLAESGDTLFASFIGTKQYKDMIADANILQGALFHEDGDADNMQEEEEIEAVTKSDGITMNNKEPVSLKLGAAPSVRRSKPKPAAHRGFLARARGIPAVELYRLAKRKDCRLVLCGHSLGGAVAVLATLAILKVLASIPSSPSSTSDSSKTAKSVEVKCITFSQPPVGNAALRDYVHEKGWHGHFRTYCIPEDLIPRILSPAYFHHYHTQAQPKGSGSGNGLNKPTPELAVTNPVGTESIVLGLGNFQKSLRRISTLVPLVNPPKPILRFKSKKVDSSMKPSKGDLSSVKRDIEAMSGSLGIQDTTGTAALASVSRAVDAERLAPELGKASHIATTISIAPDWRSRVPSLPSYVPFGQLFLLGKSSVEQLSASEFTRLSSMQSVLSELRDRFQSHTMRSYRSRFQRVYDSCMGSNIPPSLSMDHGTYMPHLQQWLGLPGTTMTELGKIAEPLAIHSATSLVPIGWTGVPAERKGTSFRIDVCGSGLHLCTLVKAQINGQWCSATVETLPAQPSSLHKETFNSYERLQKMRVRIGSPIEESSQQASSTTVLGVESTPEIERPTDKKLMSGSVMDALWEERNFGLDGPDDVIIHCSSDFVTASKKAVIRLRHVRLLGLEGAGKTSLYYALLGQSQGTVFSASDGIFPDVDRKEGVTEGVAYVDPVGVNLQDLAGEVDQLKQELSFPHGQMGKKVDMVILVHNLAHKIPRLHQSVKPALSILMEEVATAGIPHILAITNKFAVSADRREAAAATVMKAYQVPTSLAIVVNSCPYSVHGVATRSTEMHKIMIDGVQLRNTNFPSKLQGATQRLISAPINLVQIPFRRKEVVLPVEGVKSLKALVNRVLLDHEDAALAELSREQLLLELKNELAHAASHMPKRDDGISAATAMSAVGASISLVVAVIAAVACSLPKPKS